MKYSTVLARRSRDGITVTLSTTAIESIQQGNFGGTYPCAAISISGEKYTIEPSQFGTLKSMGFRP